MAQKILIADDSITIQKVIGLTFANEDYDLQSADNGDEALEMATASPPDMIIADTNMPGLSGYDLCEQIRQTAALAHIPVVLLTGTYEVFDEERAQRVGANGYLTKPFESQALIAKVRELLAASTAAAAPAAEAPAAEVPEADATDFEEITEFEEIEHLEPVEEFEPSDVGDPVAENARRDVSAPINDGGSLDFGDLNEQTHPATPEPTNAEPEYDMASFDSYISDDAVAQAAGTQSSKPAPAPEPIHEPEVEPEPGLAPEPDLGDNAAWRQNEGSVVAADAVDFADVEGVAVEDTGFEAAAPAAQAEPEAEADAATSDDIFSAFAAYEAQQAASQEEPETEEPFAVTSMAEDVADQSWAFSGSGGGAPEQALEQTDDAEFDDAQAELETDIGAATYEFDTEPDAYATASESEFVDDEPVATPVPAAAPQTAHAAAALDTGDLAERLRPMVERRIAELLDDILPGAIESALDSALERLLGELRRRRS